MGRILVRHVLDGEEIFLVWSTVVDAPVTYGGSFEQIQKMFWGDALILNRDRFSSLEKIWAGNRAGKDETCLTMQQIVDYYLIQKGVGPVPIGLAGSEPETTEEIPSESAPKSSPKGTIRQRARKAANAFKVGRGRAWAWVGDKDMIIDAVCMDEIRTAALFEHTSISPEELLEFRKAFCTAIYKMGYVL